MLGQALSHGWERAFSFSAPRLAAGPGIARASGEPFDLRLADGARYSTYLELSESRERALLLAMGGEAIYKSKMHPGIDLSVKSAWAKKAPPAAAIDQPPMNGNTIAFDLGALLSADLLKETGTILSPSIGFSMLNQGSPA